MSYEFYRMGRISGGLRKSMLPDKSCGAIRLCSFWKERSRSPLDYFYEQRRLLQSVDTSLPELLIVLLVSHDRNFNFQKQVQLKSPTALEALRNLSAI